MVRVLTEFFICLNLISNSSQNPSLQIQLPDGLIQGRVKHTADTGLPYYSYEGIPYARPPVGALRFKPPQPPNKWEGVLNAGGSDFICYQTPPLPIKGVVESEDCLYLNVYVPKPSPETNRPKAVMVWIYGGAFLVGHAGSSFYGPDYLVEKDVILVTFNYRLNVFGFLATGDTASPGNYGLKDQQAALKWVKTNIHLFGGDSDRITIFGESAGGASVQFHLLSTKSHGLFSSAISQSGSVLSHWAFQPHPKRVALHLGQLAGFFNGNTQRLVSFLRELKAENLRDLATATLVLGVLSIYAPVVEPHHEDALLSESPYVLLRNKQFAKVPYIVGFNTEESGAATGALELVKPILGLLPIPGEMLIPPSLNNQNPVVGDEIKKYYFSDKSKSISKQYVAFFSDTSFYRPITEAARLYSLAASIYMYRFAYSGYHLGKKAILKENDELDNSTTHAEELWYIFSRHDLVEASVQDKAMRNIMVTLWSNFAKYGNPTPEAKLVLQNITWRKYQRNDYFYLNIDKNLTIESRFEEETMKFWKNIFDKYGKPPFYTY